MNVGCIYIYVILEGLYRVLHQIKSHGPGFDYIWQVILKLSSVAEVQNATRMTETPQLLDVNI